MDGHGPGAYLTTGPTPDGDATVVTIRLYDEQAELLAEETGLAALRDMIAQDRVPIPVNDAARGRIEEHRSPTGGTR